MSTVDAASIHAECTSCGSGFRAKAALAGKRVKCPKCGDGLRVPDLPPTAAAPQKPPPLPPSPGDFLRLRCSGCGASIKAPAAAGGKRVRCPKCSAPVAVPAGASPPAAPRDAAESFDDDLLGALSDGEQVADAGVPRATASMPTRPCPGCAASMALAATVCTSCGFNIKTGKRSKAATGAATMGEKLAKAASGAAVGSQRFLMGVGGCMVGALLGGAIWFAIAYALHIQVGYVGIAVGLLSGGGMLLGYGAPSIVGGIISAAAAVGAILLAKYTMFAIVFAPLLTSHAEQTLDPREQLAAFYAEIDQEEVDIPKNASVEQARQANEEAYQAALGEAKERVAKMSDAEVREDLAKLLDAYSEFKATVQPIAFFAVMFGARDVLFFLLAVGAALKVGSMGWPE